MDEKVQRKVEEAAHKSLEAPELLWDVRRENPYLLLLSDSFEGLTPQMKEKGVKLWISEEELHLNPERVYPYSLNEARSAGIVMSFLKDQLSALIPLNWEARVREDDVLVYESSWDGVRYEMTHNMETLVPTSYRLRKLYPGGVCVDSEWQNTLRNAHTSLQKKSLPK